MPVLQKILFPVDFSEPCQEIASQVEAFARQCAAEITLLHVVSLPTDGYGDSLPMDPELFPDWAQWQAKAQNQLDSYLPAMFGGCRVRRVVESGDPAKAISRYARSQGVNLIMMPTHGLGVFRRLLLGSVTAKVLHDSVCPVWTGIHHAEIAKTEARKTLLCAIDLTPTSVAVLRFAISIANQLRLEPRIVHAIPAPEAAPDAKAGPFRNFLFSVAREELSKIQTEAGTDIPECVKGGPISHVVGEAALESNASLVLIGRGHLPRLLGELRTHAYTIIRQSPVPVISL